MLVACPNCSARLMGIPVGHIVIDWKPKDFCYKCGQPYPWATREAIAYHVENMLEEEPDLSDGDRRALREQLDTLRESPADAASEKRQVAAVRFLQKAAPKVWQVAQPIIQVLLTSEAKRQLGLPLG